MSRQRKSAVGSNQYRTRPPSDVVPIDDLLLQVISDNYRPMDVDDIIEKLSDDQVDDPWELTALALQRSASSACITLCKAMEYRLIGVGSPPSPDKVAVLIDAICDRNLKDDASGPALWLRSATCAILLTDTPHCDPVAAEKCARLVLEPPVGDTHILDSNTSGVMLRRLSLSASLPDWAFHQLARRPDCWLSLACNPNCPPDLLVFMLQEGSKPVSEAALRNPSMPEEYRLLHTII